MSEAIFQLDAIRFAYPGGHRVFDGLDFALRDGERIALHGTNGAGKTTLLHLMVGLLLPDAGEVRAFGRVRRSDADFREVRARAGLLFEDPEDQLFSTTVGEDVAFGPFNLGKPRHEVAECVAGALDALGLAGYEQRITYRLSRGEKRLVSLATVLAMEPQVLLLDEPTSGLDEEHTEMLVELLTTRSTTHVVVSHNPRFVERVTDRTFDLPDTDQHLSRH